MAKPQSTQDALRAHAGRSSGTRWQEALEDLATLEEAKTAAEEAAEALDEFDTATEALTRIQETVGSLVEMGLAPQAVLDDVNEALTLIENANGVISADDLRTFAEAYDEASQALETYGDTKEGDRYEGKREDLESQWDDATSNLEATADAYDALEVVEEPAQTPLSESDKVAP